MGTHLASDGFQSVKGDPCRLSVGAYRHGQSIENKVFFRYAVLLRRFQYLFRNFHSALGGARYAVFVKSEGNGDSAVFLHQGKYRLHTLRFAVYGIYERFSVIASQCPLHGGGRGGVDLQRQVDYGLKLTYRIFQNACLVKLRKSHIHIKNVDSAVLLTYSLRQNIIRVVFQQRLLKAFFARRIYPFPYEHGVVRKKHRFCVGGNAGEILFIYGLQRNTDKAFRKCADIFGGSTAAASRDPYALKHQLFCLARKLVCIYIVYGLSVFVMRKSCVGFHNHRDFGIFQIIPYHRGKSVGAEGAIDSDGVRAHSLKHCNHSGGIGSRHKLAVLAVGIGNKHGQVTVFLCGKQSGLRLVAVAHGLYHYQIHAAAAADFYSFGKNGNRLLKIKAAERLQQPPQGTYIQSNEFRLRRFAFPRCRKCVFTGGKDYFFKFPRLKIQTVCAECVGIYHIAARVKIRLVYILYHGGMCNIEKLRAAACGKSPLLQESAHTAVKNKNILLHIFGDIHSSSGFAPCGFIRRILCPQAP